jgi:hypothetical protein
MDVAAAVGGQCCELGRLLVEVASPGRRCQTTIAQIGMDYHVTAPIQ